MFIYNFSFNALCGGIGAAINHPKNEKWHQSFAKGFIKGGAGGTVIYTSKRMIGLQSQFNSYTLGLPANLVHATGTSMVENAAMNRRLFEKMNFILGPIRMQFKPKDTCKFQLQLMPYSIYSIGSAIHIGKRFDWKNSLSTGELVFTHPTQSLLYEDGNAYWGYSLGGALVLAKNNQFITQTTLAHEQIHQFQFREYLNINTFFNPIHQKLDKKKFYKKYLKHVYFDIDWSLIAYQFQSFNYNQYYKQFYEFEAERFASNAYVKR